MGRYKNRPQYIEKQLKEVNKFLRETRVKDQFSNDLFSWWCDYLLTNKWYRGFNYHYDKIITLNDGSTKVINALAGPDYHNKDYYLQIW